MNVDFKPLTFVKSEVYIQFQLMDVMQQMYIQLYS